MRLESVTAADDALSELADLASRLPEERDAATQMSLTIQLARLYLLEYMRHVVDGLEPYDAVVATVRGDLRLSQHNQDLMRAAMPLNRAAR